MGLRGWLVTKTPCPLLFFMFRPVALLCYADLLCYDLLDCYAARFCYDLILCYVALFCYDLIFSYAALIVIT